MNFLPTPLAGAYVLEPTALRDVRGYFARVFCERTFAERGLCTRFVQANHSLSLRRGTVRGLHYQLPPHTEVKLFRCIRGAVHDIMVDLRRGSPTFLRWHAEILSEDNLKMVYVPAGFAHGFQALADGSSVTYQASSAYSPGHERGVRYDDPLLGIAWPEPEAIVSPKDLGWPGLDPGFAGVALAEAADWPRGQKRPAPREQEPPEVLRKLAELEAENARLHRLVGELRSGGRLSQEANVLGGGSSV